MAAELVLMPLELVLMPVLALVLMPAALVLMPAELVLMPKTLVLMPWEFLLTLKLLLTLMLTRLLLILFFLFSLFSCYGAIFFTAEIEANVLPYFHFKVGHTYASSSPTMPPAVKLPIVTAALALVSADAQYIFTAILFFFFSFFLVTALKTLRRKLKRMYCVIFILKEVTHTLRLYQPIILSFKKAP